MSLSYCLFVNVFFPRFSAQNESDASFLWLQLLLMGSFFHVESLRYSLLTVQVVAVCFMLTELDIKLQSSVLCFTVKRVSMWMGLKNCCDHLHCTV